MKSASFTVVDFKYFQHLLATVLFCLAVLLSGSAQAVNESSRINDLKARMKTWQPPVAFMCPNIHGAFPAKTDQPFSRNPAVTPACDDGDMTLFNGLLCLSGEQRGCDGVRRAQGPDGRWWRSPNRIGSHEAANDTEQATFSPDQALGVIAYLIAKKDGHAFNRWVDWMQKNPRCDSSNCVPAGALRFCEDARCAFRLGDCPLLDRVSWYLKRPTSVCDLPMYFGVAIPTKYQQKIDDFKKLVRKVTRIDLSGLEAATNRWLSKFDELNKLRGIVGGGPLTAEMLAELDDYLGSLTNDEGYSRHLAGVEVLLLQALGFNTPLVPATAKTLANKEPTNPFFVFLNEGSSSRVLDLILSECPAQPTDQPRFQWSWERAAKEQSWKRTMYWDCIFISRLYLHGPIRGHELVDPYNGKLAALRGAANDTKNATINMLNAGLSAAGEVLKQHQALLQAKSDALSASQSALDAVATKLSEAVNQLQQANNALASARAAAANLADQKRNIESQLSKLQAGLSNLTNQLVNTPARVAVQVCNDVSDKICPGGKWNPVCRIVTKTVCSTVEQTNDAFTHLQGEINGLAGKINDANTLAKQVADNLVAATADVTTKAAAAASEQIAVQTLQTSKDAAESGLQVAQAGLAAEQALVNKAAQPVTDLQNALKEVKLWAF